MFNSQIIFILVVKKINQGHKGKNGKAETMNPCSDSKTQALLYYTAN